MTEDEFRWGARLLMLFTLWILTLTLLGCSVSTGGYYIGHQGPHPHVNVAVAARLGPLEVLHAPLSNARPVSDLTHILLSFGPTLGRWRPTVGAGWAWFRSWGACDSTGYNCAHDWTDAFTVGAGLTYRIAPARIDGALHCYDGAAPVSCGGTLMLGIDL